MKGRRGALVVSRGAVLLEGSDLLLVCQLVRIGADHVRRVDRLESPHVRELLALLASGAAEVRVAVDQSVADVADLADVREEVGSGSSVQEFISSKEAAVMLHITERQVRRLAQDLDGLKRGSAWVFDRATVTQYALESGRVVA